MPRKWSKEDEEFLLENREILTRKELAEKFEVTPKAVGDKLRKLLKTTEKKQLSDEKAEDADDKAPDSETDLTETKEKKTAEETVEAEETVDQKAYLKKGMERLAGSDKMVETSIKMVTDEGLKPIKINRKKITY